MIYLEALGSICGRYPPIVVFNTTIGGSLVAVRGQACKGLLDRLRTIVDRGPSSRSEVQFDLYLVRSDILHETHNNLVLITFALPIGF